MTFGWLDLIVLVVAIIVGLCIRQAIDMWRHRQWVKRWEERMQ